MLNYVKNPVKMAYIDMWNGRIIITREDGTEEWYEKVIFNHDGDTIFGNFILIKGCEIVEKIPGKPLIIYYPRKFDPVRAAADVFTVYY